MSVEDVPEQPENVPGRAIAWTLAITTLVIATCAVIVWSLAAFHIPIGGASAVKRIELVPPAQPFSETMQPERTAAAARLQLEQWSWADRRTGRVRLPVNVALDRYLQAQGAR
jgi:hypothetical protein